MEFKLKVRGLFKVCFLNNNTLNWPLILIEHIIFTGKIWKLK